MSQATREGFGWTGRDKYRVREPLWTTEPKLWAIEVVCRRVLDLKSEEVCTVEFFSSGAFNKLYLIGIPSRQQRLLLRASLPVDPYHKTLGEVATLEWVRRFTNIPVPYIIAYDPSSDNEIGFEWLLMPFIPGRTAYKAWRKMSMAAKEAFTRQVAEFEAQLLSASELSNMRGIGTLTSPAGKPGHLVDRHWFMGDHFQYPVPRGPFHSSREWLDADVRIAKWSMGTDYLETQDIFVTAIHLPLEVTDKLLKALPTVFPVTDEREPTTLSHQDLRLENILVDEKGVIVAVLDWEFAAAIPRWLATEMPEFLQGKVRTTEPIREDYDDEDPEQEVMDHDRLYHHFRQLTARGPRGNHHKTQNDDMILDNEGKETWFWYDMMEYEQTNLRKVYTARMRELRPTWDAEVAGSVSKRDFFKAVKLTDADRWTYAVSIWVTSTFKYGYNFRLVDIWNIWREGWLDTMLPKMKNNDYSSKEYRGRDQPDDSDY